MRRGKIFYLHWVIQSRQLEVNHPDSHGLVTVVFKKYAKEFQQNQVFIQFALA